MFEQFTGQARRVVQLAYQVAHRFHHDYLGTEHLFLALVEENPAAIEPLFRKQNIELAKASRVVEQSLVTGPTAVSGHQLLLTEHARRSIEIALDESQQAGQSLIAPEHLLLGLLAIKESEAMRLLQGIGLDLAAMSAEARKLPVATNRDAMMQPAPTTGPLLRADPTPRQVEGLVAATPRVEVVETPPKSQPMSAQAAEQIQVLHAAVVDTEWQLTGTQVMLGIVLGLWIGQQIQALTMAGGLLVAVTVASLRSSLLSSAVAGVGAYFAIRPQGKLWLTIMVVAAAVLVGSYVGNFWRMYAPSRRRPEPPLDDFSTQ